MEVSLDDILAARDRRVEKQQALLAQYGKPLICFTMNIPGPEKFNKDIAIGFSVGNQLLQGMLHGQTILYKELSYTDTGCEGWYVVDEKATALKYLAMSVEDTDSIGRLFDVDVLDIDGRKISREDMQAERRKCLLCDNDAAICARSRAHGLAQLQDRVGFLLYLCARQWQSEFIATRAWLALNTEYTTTPKPGLVDRNNRGAHKDMGLSHFFVSANALRPYFGRFAEQGFLTRDLPAGEAFPQIRTIGIEAEKVMFQATGGVNTHKGAIFSMGLLCAAAGRLSPDLWTPEALCAEAAAICKGIVALDLGGITAENARTFGERIYAEYGITGIRGQAESGFPAVTQVGLPVLQKGLENGLSLNDAGCAALLHLVAATDDTNLIHRSNRETQLQVQSEILQLLTQTPYPATAQIEDLDKEFIKKNLSPGGSADLLALTYFLHFLCS